MRDTYCHGLPCHSADPKQVNGLCAGCRVHDEQRIAEFERDAIGLRDALHVADVEVEKLRPIARDCEQRQRDGVRLKEEARRANEYAQIHSRDLAAEHSKRCESCVHIGFARHCKILSIVVGSVFSCNLWEARAVLQ